MLTMWQVDDIDDMHRLHRTPKLTFFFSICNLCKAASTGDERVSVYIPSFMPDWHKTNNCEDMARSYSSPINCKLGVVAC